MVPGNIDKLLVRAKQAIAARDWDKAKQCYLMALGLRSDLPDIHYGLATVYFQLGELTSAAHHFREVTRLDPLRAGAYINLGAVLNVLQQYDEAITSLRRGIQLDPQRVEGYYNLGLVYRRKGQLELAIQAYREALRLNPRLADTHLNLGNLLVEKGQFKQAIQHYDHALTIRPSWEKAQEAREIAREELEAEEKGSVRPAASSAPAARQAAKAPAGTVDLDRTADPAVHAHLLTALNHAAVATEGYGRKFQQVLGEEVEVAIKELSTCLLYPDTPLTELDSCVTRFETALEHMRTAQHNLEMSLTRLHELEKGFPNVS
jgi:tetratricopeptide (TPR) repeat protein